MEGQTWRRLKWIIIVFFKKKKKKVFHSSWKLWFFKTFFQSLFLLFATFDIHNALGKYLIVWYEAVNFSFSRKILAIKRCRQKQPDEQPYFLLISRTSVQTNSNNRIKSFIVDNSKQGQLQRINRRKVWQLHKQEFKEFSNGRRFGQRDCCGGRLMDKIKPKTLNWDLSVA